MNFSELFTYSNHVRSQIIIAEQLLTLLEKPGSLRQAAVLCYELSNLERLLPDDGISFYDMHLYAGFLLDQLPDSTGATPPLGDSKRIAAEFRTRLQAAIAASRARFNPAVTKKDTLQLDKHLLPLLTALRDADSTQRPKLFLQLCQTAISRVEMGQLSMFAAAQDIHYSLDRPEIQATATLKAVVAAAEQLGQPDLITQGDPKTAWQAFVQAVHEAVSSGSL